MYILQIMDWTRRTNFVEHIWWRQLKTVSVYACAHVRACVVCLCSLSVWTWSLRSGAIIHTPPILPPAPPLLQVHCRHCRHCRHRYNRPSSWIWWTRTQTPCCTRSPRECTSVRHLSGPAWTTWRTRPCSTSRIFRTTWNSTRATWSP